MIIPSTEFLSIVRGHWHLIDVRSELEYEKSHLPDSVNLPILNNEHRVLVGTSYKREGREKALSLGHSLVSGDYRKDLVERWKNSILQSQKKQAAIFCWRGGLRSKISQDWLREVGIEIPRLEGGYKAFRNFILEEQTNLVSSSSAIVVSGVTGSGKSDLLNELKFQLAVIDLEKIANHRGSAFGAFNTPQPTQAQFENNLSWDIIRTLKDVNSTCFFEDESRMVGTVVLPEAIFSKIRSSPVVIIEEPLSRRVDNIYRDYILNSGLIDEDEHIRSAVIKRYRTSFQNISKKLGGLKFKMVLELFQSGLVNFSHSKDPSGHKEWIEILLKDYYDPLYLKSLDKRSPKTLFKGSYREVKHYLLNLK